MEVLPCVWEEEAEGLRWIVGLQENTQKVHIENRLAGKNPASVSFESCGLGLTNGECQEEAKECGV